MLERLQIFVSFFLKVLMFLVCITSEQLRKPCEKNMCNNCWRHNRIILELQLTIVTTDTIFVSSTASSTDAFPALEFLDPIRVFLVITQGERACKVGHQWRRPRKKIDNYSEKCFPIFFSMNNYKYVQNQALI